MFHRAGGKVTVLFPAAHTKKRRKGKKARYKSFPFMYVQRQVELLCVDRSQNNGCLWEWRIDWKKWYE